ncbi:MAG: TolC family protein [Spirochaetaceae bacterium]|nr:MAG: TolC family protein [Spirochaetaceae bacterium]
MKYQGDTISAFFAPVVLLLALLPVSWAGAAETLSLTTAVRRVLESDPGIQVSRNRTLQARERYNLTLSGTRPRADLEVRPYTYDRRRTPPGPSPAGDTQTYSVGAGLFLRQPLTTSGALSAGIDHTTRRVSPEEGADRWDQVPEVSLRWDQPLMAGEQIIGSRLFRAGLREAEIGFSQAEYIHEATRNDAVREVLELYTRTGNLRRSTELLRETIELLRRQLESAELDRQQGLISDTALLALQVTLNNRREALFSTQLQLVQVEQLLARSMGMDGIEGMELEDLPETLPIPQFSDLRTAVRDNPRVRVGELTVEQAEKQTILGTATDRPSLSLFARAMPVYPAEREEPDSFSASFSDLFTSDAGIDVTAGLAVTVPLLTARQRAYRTRIDELTRRNAVLELEDLEQVLANMMRTLTMNRRFLEERLELLEMDIDYEERRVQNERTLLEAGVTTDLRVREVELDLRSRLNERSRVRAELLLNSLDILSLLGEDLEALFLSSRGT